MILILGCLFYLFLNAMLSLKGVGRKIFGEKRGQNEHQDREIAPISPLPFYQWRVRGRIGMHPGITSREHCIRAPRKKWKLFYGEIPISGKMPNLFRFQPNFVRKIFVPGPHLALITPAS